MATRPPGPRKTLGRPTSAATELRKRLIDEHEEEARYALGYLCEVMRDKKEPTRIRIQAAEMVMDQIWGKPKQRLEHTGAEGAPIEFIEVVTGNAE